MTGAVSFHLFTPLGTDPNNDGGGLFMAASILWLFSIVLMVIRHRELQAFFQGLYQAFFGKNAGTTYPHPGPSL
jgi:hypothetical protein